MIALNLDHMAEIYYIKGMYDLAINMYNQSLNIAEELGDQKGIGRALNNIAMAYDAKGDSDQALVLYNQSLEIKIKIGDQKRDWKDPEQHGRNI